jgi:hypothetical protein
MRRQENSIKTVRRYLFRGMGLVFVIGLVEAVTLFMGDACRWNRAEREREERTRIEAKQRYERQRAEAIRKGTDPNSAVRKLNSGKWLPEERRSAK